MKIQGAVLEQIGSARPYQTSRPIQVSNLDLADPKGTELLVRIEAAGVCHSDLSVVNGDRKRPVPMLLGHEAAGIIESCGDAVQDLSVGQRVVMTFLPRCENCDHCAQGGQLPCINGSKANNEGALLDGSRRLSRDGEEVHHHLGVSGFASYAVVNQASVVPVGSDVPSDVAAALGCAVLTGGGAYLNAVKPSGDQSVMIVGLGGVGMAALLTAVAEGCDEIIAVDMADEKLEMAREWGATSTYTPAQVAEQGIKANHTLECAGKGKAFETAFEATRVGGRTVTIGLPSPADKVELTPATITGEARTIIGSYLGSSVPARDIPRFERLWREGKLPIERLITSKISLSQVNEAMDDLADGRAIRQVIQFDNPSEGTET